MKPNVLQLIGSFNQGGSERQAVQLFRLLKEGGRFNVHIACLDGSGPLRKELEQFQIGNIAEFPLTSFYDRNMVTQLRRFARFLRDHEIDVLHTHDFYTNIFGMAGATFSRLSIARIASRRETGGMRTRAQAYAQQLAFGRADAVVVNADAVRNELVNEGVREDKIEIVYNGLDLKRISPLRDLDRTKVLEQLGLANAGDRRLITIVANMRHAVKDQHTFLRAAKQIHAEVDESVFVLAGEGELMEPLRAFAAELGLAHETFFIGPCERVADLLAVSEVCVLSSTHEGFSNSIIEYMAASRPVVVTDVGGAREAVIQGETGFIVPAGDDTEMASRVISLLRDPSRAAEMGRQGRRIVEEKFSCQSQLNKTELLYDRLLSARTSAELASGKRISHDHKMPAGDRR